MQSETDYGHRTGQEAAPLVSAVIITHNRRELLEKAIRSVLDQTWPNMECIVVDDASSDGTEGWMNTNPFFDTGKKINYLRIDPEESKGGNHARNIGARAAGGRYLAFLDDDDQWKPDKIEKQIQIMQEEGTKICYCGLQKVNPEGTVLSEQNTENLLKGDLSRKIMQGVICTTSAMMIQRDAFFETGEFDEDLKYWQEYDFCIRAFQKFPVSVLRENSVRYLVNPRDQGRLTNHLESWEKALPGFLRKHEVILSQLTEEERKTFDLFVNGDAITRSHLAGDHRKLRKYLWKRYRITGRSKDLLKAILNYDRRFG